MKWNPFGRSKPPAERKESAVGPDIVQFYVGQPVWSERNYETFAREGYAYNAIVYRCVSLIAQAAASVKLDVYSGDKILDAHPIMDLLARPNPTMSGHFLSEASYSFLTIAGNAYIEAVGPENGPPAELWYLRPDRMKVIPGPQGMPEGYEHEVNGKTRRFSVNFLTGQSPILHVKEFNPVNDFYGMARTEPAARAIDRLNAISDHNKALLDNGARPSGALIYRNHNVGDNVITAPQAVITKAEEMLAERHSGAANAGRPMVLNGNVDWQSMGLSPVDMDHAGNALEAAREICHAYGIPISLVLPGESTYSNKAEAKLEFWESTVLPMVELMVGEWNNWLAPKYGNDIELAPDLDSVSALEPRREKKRASIMELVSAGIIDADEGREDLGYGERKPGTVEKVDAAVLNGLVQAMPSIGSEPVLRYLKSVGLYDPNTTIEQMVAAALDLEDEPDPDDEIDDDNVTPFPASAT